MGVAHFPLGAHGFSCSFDSGAVQRAFHIRPGVCSSSSGLTLEFNTQFSL